MILCDLLRHHWGLFEFGNAPTQWCTCPPFLGCHSRPSQKPPMFSACRPRKAKPWNVCLIELVNLPIKTAHDWLSIHYIPMLMIYSSCFMVKLCQKTILATSIGHFLCQPSHHFDDYNRAA